MDWVLIVAGVVMWPTGMILLLFYGQSWGWPLIAFGTGCIVAPFAMRMD